MSVVIIITGARGGGENAERTKKERRGSRGYQPSESACPPRCHALLPCSYPPLYSSLVIDFLTSAG